MAIKTPPGKVSIIAGVVVVVVLLVVILVLRESVRRLSPEEISQRIVATIQSEAEASILITGNVDITATVTIENAKRLLPGVLDIDLGTARAVVQVPGRAYYGFDVRDLTQDKISIRGDTVSIQVPPPKVFSVDANLQQMRIWSQKGWLRSASSVQEVERAAISQIDAALARQAAAHVGTSTQPRVNTAEGIRKMITPVLAAAGITNPVFQFALTERLRIE
jgi:hypothetical protein